MSRFSVVEELQLPSRELLTSCDRFLESLHFAELVVALDPHEANNALRLDA